ncbi:MAG: helix-turn-helix domain-containing protein [Candidatus Eremiobacteraeota bacterium]|nr:helix-turn-helix domain-containing protein [Candidatus Eremiobacteraeota bacterium]
MRKSLLTQFLRSHRMRLKPSDVGLPAEAGRRVEGLRRNEVALLADVGVTWYTWLEQGRSIKLASATLDRIANALRLDGDETEYLRKLVASHTEELPPWDTPVPPRVVRLVETRSAPAFVRGARWDLMHANERYRSVLCTKEWSGAYDRNYLWFLFTNPAARSIFPNWTTIAERATAMFRFESASYADEPSFRGLISDLFAVSAEFTELWNAGRVVSPFAPRFDQLRHPDGSEVTYETILLSIPDAPNLTVCFMLPYEEELT